MSKKIILSLLLVLCVAFSVSAVTAENSEDLAITDADDSDISSSVDETPISTAKSEDTGTFKGLDEKINGLADGDELSLKENSVYDVSNKTWEIKANNVKISGKNTTINAKGSTQPAKGNLGTFTLIGTNITIYGIIFNNTDGAKAYGDSVSGIPISMKGESQTMDNCTSINFSKGVMLAGATNAKIINSYFTGSTTSVTGTGKGEKGTYGVAGGATTNNVLVENNIFDGQMLDGISFYGNSRTYVIKNNTFKNNVYAIYFGGGSTEGSVISENKFIDCGYCVDNTNKIITDGLCVISTEKASDGYKLLNNTFTVRDNIHIVKAQSANTAHGYPSPIGNITISGNKVTTINDDVNADSITFVHILSNSGPLNPNADIVIKDNELPDNLKHVTVWYKDWGDENGDVIIPQADKIVTSLEIADISTSDKKLVVLLKQFNGTAMPSEKISYKINGGAAVNATTDDKGQLVINLKEDGKVDISFEGNDKFKGSSTSIVFKVPSVEKTVEKTVEKIVEKAPEAQATKLTAAKKTFKRKAKTKKVSATLKTSAGKAIKNKYVSFKIGKKTYVAKTNSKGVATVSVKLTKKGKYTVKVTFDGDAGYKKASNSAKIVVK